MTSPLICKDAVDTAVRLLTFRSYSSFEMRQKLSRRGFNEQDIEATITYLARYNYVNDHELCTRLYDRLLHSGKYGRKAIIQKLQQKGIASSIIDGVTSQKNYDEKNAARMLVAKKFGLPIPADQKKKAARYLNTRGFSYETIRNVLDLEG